MSSSKKGSIVFDANAVQGKYLTFSLGDEEYGIAIFKVREIIGIVKTTAIPRVPDHVKGVINLRGKVIPVIDMRLKFDLAEREYDEQTCIIVVEAKKDTSSAELGIIVDRVNEVLPLKAENIEPAPRLAGEVDTQFILGMGKADERVCILLDIDKTLTETELSALENVS